MILGYDVPSPKILLLILLAFAILLILSRFGFLSGLGGGSSTSGGAGRRWQCQRCGTNFQPEHVEVLPNGQERHWIDERCPHCGWDKDFTDPDHDGRPGDSRSD